MKKEKTKKIVKAVKKSAPPKASSKVKKVNADKVKETRKKKVTAPQATDLLNAITKIADEKSAFDFHALEVKELSSITDYFLLMSCKNERHIKAVVTEIDKKIFEECGIKPFHIDGEYRSLWVVIDYGDVMVHVFHENTRGLYNLEELWKEGKSIPLKNR